MKSKKAWVSTRMKLAIAASLLFVFFPAITFAQSNNNFLGEWFKDLTDFATKLSNGFNTIASVAPQTGTKGDMDPNATAKDLKDKTAKDSPTNADSQVGWATGNNSGQKILGKEGQDLTKERETEVSELDKYSLDTVGETVDLAAEAQGLESSQDVLKRISTQLSKQAVISDVQMRLSAIQTGQAQQLAEQAASSNVAISADLKKKLSEQQSKNISNFSANEVGNDRRWAAYLVNYE
jgi:hypothetical protein